MQKTQAEKRWAWAEAMKVAEVLRTTLLPFVERIEIAGSLRRRKADVGDIELLFIPRVERQRSKKDFFADEDVDLAGEQIEKLVEVGILARRLSKTGVATWGAQNKLAVHRGSGIPVDFFATSPSRWWVSLVIRTGSKETNLKLTTGAQARGCRLNAYGEGITLATGTPIAATSEEHVFELCGVPYVVPEKR